MKNTGDFLEIIIAEIEHHLAGNTKTEINRRYKILDREGMEREIDIYFEVQVNFKKLKYAIECKDYGINSSVKMEHIDSFYSKISNHGIKGIFVSTGKFQKNAVEKAKKLNIDIYTLSDTHFNDIDRVELHQKKYSLENITLSCTGINESIVNNQEYVYVEDFLSGTKTQRKKIDFIKYIKLSMIEKIEVEFLKLFDKLYNSKWEIGEKKQYKFIHGFDPVYFIKVNNQFTPINEAAALLEFWIDVTKMSTIKSKQYQTLNAEFIFAKIFSQKIILNNDKIGYFSMIWIEGEKEPRSQILDSKGHVLSTFYHTNEFNKKNKQDFK